MSAEASNILSVGRHILQTKAPYISQVTYALIPRPVYDVPDLTIATTRHLNMLYNPAWILKKAEEEGSRKYETMAGLLYHECWHVLLKHMEPADVLLDAKRTGLDIHVTQQLRNYAQDLVINSMLRKGSWRLPPGGLYPETFGFDDGLVVEQYFKLLVERHKARDQSLKNSMANAGVACGSCGTVAGNAKHEALEREFDKDFGRSAAEIETLKQETYDLLEQHEAANMRGRGGGSWSQHLAFTKEPPKVPWTQILRRTLSRSIGHIKRGEGDFSYSHIDQNAALCGVILPGEIEEEIDVLFVRDTSGSMSNEDLNTANNEIIEAVKALGVQTVWLLDVDAVAHGEPKQVNVRDIPTLDVKGRGGTSFHPAFNAAEAMRPRPSLLVYMTDGGGSAPSMPPKGMQVIWCIVPSAHACVPTHWGHMVVCSEKPEDHKRILG